MVRIKVFSCFWKDNSWNYNQLSDANGIFTVVESYLYKIIIETNEIIDNSHRIWLEDFPLEVTDYLHNNKVKIETYERRFFEDYWGEITLTFADTKLQFDVLTKKIDSNEAFELIKYLFEKGVNLPILLSKTILKKNTSAGDLYSTSIKMLNQLSDFTKTFEILFPKFSTLPKTSLREAVSIERSTATTDSSYSLQWLLGNLDEIFFDDDFKYHPDSFRVSGRYALVNSIAVEKKVDVYTVYENQLIIGAFKKAISIVNEIDFHLTSKIINSDKQTEDGVSLRSVFYLACLYGKQRCAEVSRKILPLYKRYLKIFGNINGLVEYPKVTSTFKKIGHYRMAYSALHLMFNQRLNLDSDNILFNIRKMSQLYEMYIFHVLLETVQGALSQFGFKVTKQESNRKDNILSEIVFATPDNIRTLKLFYEPRITRSTSRTSLSRIDFGELDDTYPYYEPDFVIEFRDERLLKTRVAILDAKYRSWNSLRKDIHKIGSKYILGTGIAGQPFNKVEFLALVAPNLPNHEGIIPITKPGFYPSIIALGAKPNFTEPLSKFITEICDYWQISD